MIKKILVVGASGYVGSHLVPELANSGYQVKATGRSLSLLRKRGWEAVSNIELVELDLNNDSNLDSLLEDVDAVFFLVHGMNHGHDFIDIELGAARNFSQALKGSSVQRVIYLGALQAEHGNSKHLSARKATGEILRQSGIPITELRAGIIVGPGSAAFEVMRDFVYHLPIIITPKWVKSRTSPIALRNLLHYLLELLHFTPSRHQIMDVAGPEMLSYETQMRKLGMYVGKTVRILSTPLITPSIAAYWLKFITSVPTNIAQALVGGLRFDLPADGSAIQSLIPQYLLSYDEAVEECLGHESEVVRNEIWGFDPDALARWQVGYGYYPKQAGYTLKTDATSEQLWRQVQLIGGKEGYFYANFLWRLREWMDHCIGGEALTRYRRDPDELQLGDRVDSWKVINIKPNRFLSLLFGMKAPGLGRLEFSIEDKGEYREVDIRAWWHPAGFSGLLYWFAMMPAHLFIFRGMAHALVKRCKAKAQEGKSVTL
ncbi:SDR family oxidoreductase [Photobacterium sp. SDRW27]|uniref:SDR family oxidoreductase n=1 Tax=Photobacterium obscurum TaxID=2829490 RepID=UPI002244145F|nr:SDR family oxidoreductase [Photobacterium obscurum]MCW8327812.1 SDR family oxidoreductase [Photobacterium obscurum]